MKMNMSKRDQKLLIYVGGILLLVLVYFLFYRNMADSNEVLKREISTLVQERDRLTALSERAGEYTTETERMTGESKEIILKFPPDMREEDSIVYAHMLETLSEMHISTIEIDSKQLIYTTSTGTTMNLYDMPITYTFTVGYDSFKTVTDLILRNPDKRNMESITLSFDNGTGKLVGTTDINMYYLLGTDEIYEEPTVRPMPQGLEDIFGTVEGGTPTDTEDEDTEGEDSEDEDSEDKDSEDEDEDKDSDKKDTEDEDKKN